MHLFIKIFINRCIDTLALPGTEVWGPEAGDSWDQQLPGLQLHVALHLARRQGRRRRQVAGVFSLRRRLWRHGLTVDAAAEARGTAVSQGVELPQLVPQQVPQGRAADGAAEVGQQQVAAGTRGWGEVEGVV